MMLMMVDRGVVSVRVRMRVIALVVLNASATACGWHTALLPNGAAHRVALEVETEVVCF